MWPGYIKNKEFSLKGSRDKVHVNWLGFLCERSTRRSRGCRGRSQCTGRHSNKESNVPVLNQKQRTGTKSRTDGDQSGTEGYPPL